MVTRPSLVCFVMQPKVSDPETCSGHVCLVSCLFPLYSLWVPLPTGTFLPRGHSDSHPPRPPLERKPHGEAASDTQKGAGFGGPPASFASCRPREHEPVTSFLTGDVGMQASTCLLKPQVALTEYEVLGTQLVLTGWGPRSSAHAGGSSTSVWGILYPSVSGGFSGLARPSLPPGQRVEKHCQVQI